MIWMRETSRTSSNPISIKLFRYCSTSGSAAFQVLQLLRYCRSSGFEIRLLLRSSSFSDTVVLQVLCTWWNNRLDKPRIFILNVYFKLLNNAYKCNRVSKLKSTNAGTTNAIFFLWPLYKAIRLFVGRSRVDSGRPRSVESERPKIDQELDGIY